MTFAFTSKLLVTFVLALDGGDMLVGENDDVSCPHSHDGDDNENDCGDDDEAGEDFHDSSLRSWLSYW